ncbi:MAG TPA: RES family NAD+ phosphorylase [Kofleriaceae bacterium]|nr:RES family NAD+ phosphorylase [Kofleriaceae bacterium]
MALEPSLIPLGGLWYRHVRGGGDALGLAPGDAHGRWQRARVVGALYLADSPDTAWGEFYRGLAEHGIPPGLRMPRDLWCYRADFTEVADLTERDTLTALGLPAAVPNSTQWPVFQAVGERLARAGAQAVLYQSAARPAHRCLCVFAAALDRLTPLGHEHVDALPAPPRGMRT